MENHRHRIGEPSSWALFWFLWLQRSGQRLLFFNDLRFHDGLGASVGVEVFGYRSAADPDLTLCAQADLSSPKPGFLIIITSRSEVLRGASEARAD